MTTWDRNRRPMGSRCTSTVIDRADAAAMNLCVARRVDDRWDAAAHLGPAVNSEFNDYGPALTPDGKTLYFSSNRPQPGDRSQAQSASLAGDGA